MEWEIFCLVLYVKRASGLWEVNFVCLILSLRSLCYQVTSIHSSLLDVKFMNYY